MQVRKGMIVGFEIKGGGEGGRRDERAEGQRRRLLKRRGAIPAYVTHHLIST